MVWGEGGGGLDEGDFRGGAECAADGPASSKEFKRDMRCELSSKCHQHGTLKGRVGIDAPYKAGDSGDQHKGHFRTRLVGINLVLVQVILRKSKGVRPGCVTSGVIYVCPRVEVVEVGLQGCLGLGSGRDLVGCPRWRSNLSLCPREPEEASLGSMNTKAQQRFISFFAGESLGSISV